MIDNRFSHRSPWLSQNFLISSKKAEITESSFRVWCSILWYFLCFYGSTNFCETFIVSLPICNVIMISFKSCLGFPYLRDVFLESSEFLDFVNPYNYVTLYPFWLLPPHRWESNIIIFGHRDSSSLHWPFSWFCRRSFLVQSWFVQL